MKRPFPLPLRSKQWIIDYVMNHQLYHPMNSWNGGRVLAWNIKVHMDFDQSGQIGNRGEPVEARFDARWNAHVDADDGTLFAEACESALSYYLEGLWTPWPGPGPIKGKTRWEQGQFKFTVNGRSGGYLILTHWPGPLPRPTWRIYPLIWESRADLEYWLDGQSWKNLRLLHEVMANLDYDLRPDAIRSVMEYQYNWLRSQWEERVIADEDEDLEKLEASRPDLYNHETA